jgi:hypothetical protein
MLKKPLRVVVWSTGGIGSIAINAVKRRPDMELVGVWVHAAAKVGRDAGELAGGGAIGLAATNDKDALLALRPDCVVYAASGPERDAAAMPDYLRMLALGINVVTATSTKLIYPPAFDADLREQLAEAARAGAASIYASGIEPGFAGDHLPLTLATQSRSIRSIHACEFGLYDDYPVREVMMDAMGFGRPMNFQPRAAAPGAIIYQTSGTVRMIADALGAEVEAFREFYDRRPTARDLEVACGRIEAGTCGAVRYRCIGVIEGREAIIIEHVNRMAPDVAPDWPRGNTDLAYRVEIKGEPDIQCEMDLSLDQAGRRNVGVPHMAAGAGAMVATAMRIVNAVPFVVEAKPGVLSALDLPLTVPRHAFAAP